MDEPQILLILVGLPGSGKTTFAEALVARSWHHEPWPAEFAESSQSADSRRLGRRRWVRASQDDAPGRRRQECEAAVRRGLADGHNVLVDRVGFDRIQRSHFINIARQHQPPPQVWCLVLSVSPSTLEARLLARPDHPTIKDPETAMRVLREMTRLMDPPRPGVGEGFDRIYTLPEGRQSIGGHWTEAEVSAVLDAVAAEGKGDEGLYVPVEQQAFGNGPMPGRGGYQGRGRGRGGPWRGDSSGPYQPRQRLENPWSSRDAPAPYRPSPSYGQYPPAYAGNWSGEHGQIRADTNGDRQSQSRYAPDLRSFTAGPIRPRGPSGPEDCYRARRGQGDLAFQYNTPHPSPQGPPAP